MAQILAGSMLAGLFLVAGGAHPATATGPINLGVSTYARILVDPSTSHVFVSAGSSIVVTGLDGSIVRTITGLSSTGAMVVVATTLYVTTDTGIDRIDTGTLTETSLLVSGLVQPGDLAYAGSKLWTTTGVCTGGSVQLVSIDPADTTPTATIHVGAFNNTNQLAYCAKFATNHASNPNLLLAWTSFLAPATITSFDVSTGSPVEQQSKQESVLENLQDVAVNPDGATFITASGAPYEFDEYNLSDLTLDGIVYPANAYPNSVDTTAAAGGLMVGGIDGIVDPNNTDVVAYQVGVPQVRLASVDFAGPEPPRRAVAISPDGLTAYVITSASGSYYLNLIPLPAAPPPGSPGPPSIVSAVPGVGSATVTWTAPSYTGSAPITGYTIHSSGGATLAVGPAILSAMIAGLTPDLHTFTVTATNSHGTSIPSAPSDQITPYDGGTYNALPPSRILDTRTGNGGFPIHRVASGATLHLQVTGRGGVPLDGVSAVVMNVTVTGPTGGGFVTLYPDGLGRPASSNLNFNTGQTVANLVQVAVGSNGKVDIYVAGSSTHVIADVAGWVGDNTDSYTRNGLFQPLPPVRILDTRTGNGAVKAKLGAGQSLDLQVGGRGGVPGTGATAVVMNLTVTGPTQAGFLTAYPTGTSQPLALNINFVSGQTLANRVIVALGAGGQVTIFNAKGSVNVIADVNGWFTDAVTYAGGSSYIATVPTRILDTRAGLGKLPSGYAIHISYGQGTPFMAVVENVTAANATRTGYLTLFPDDNLGSPPPTVSDVNYVALRAIPNLTVVMLGVNLQYWIYNLGGSVDVIVDFAGYYSLVPTAPPLSPLVLHANERSTIGGPKAATRTPNLTPTVRVVRAA